MSSFEEICDFVKQFHSSSVTPQELRSYFENLSSDVCNKWKTNNHGLTEFLSTWRAKRQDIVPGPVDQPEDIDNCWAIALERGQCALVKLKGSHRALLDADTLVEEVHPRYQTETCAVDRLEDLRSFMVEKYVRQMIVHHRPRGFDQDDQKEFEMLIENLLAKGPVVVAFDVFPSYDEEFLGQGIFIPTETECQMRAYQRFPRHCVVLYGKGVQVQGSVIQEFWEALESRGIDFGDEGFVRLARHKCLIREVVELKV